MKEAETVRKLGEKEKGVFISRVAKFPLKWVSSDQNIIDGHDNSNNNYGIFLNYFCRRNKKVRKRETRQR